MLEQKPEIMYLKICKIFTETGSSGPNPERIGRWEGLKFGS